MNAPDPFTVAPDWFTAPWPLPEPMTREQYERQQIATAQSESAEKAAEQEFKS